MSSRFAFLSALGLGLLFGSQTFGAEALASNWTRFRGPNGSGLATGPDIPTEWTKGDENWRVKLPGAGHSQPVVWGERIFLRGSNADGTKRSIFCLRVKDGSQEWSYEFDAPADTKHEFSSYGSSTPALDEERVYTIYGTSESGWIKAYTHPGKEMWTVDLGPYKTAHVHGASPIVYRDMVIVSKEVQEGSFIAAFDRKSGKERWRIERENTIASYSTPCVYEPPTSEPRIFFNSRLQGITAVNPLDGKVFWEAKVLQRRSVSSPVLGPGVVVCTNGSGGGGNYLVAVRLGGSGDVTESHVAYKITQAAPYVPTPLFKGDRLYMWNRGGVVTCVNASDGEVIWRGRVGGNYYGSPIAIDDRLYCISKGGEVVVISASDEFKILGRTELGEESNSTPAVAGGRLYVRTLGQLISVGGKDLP